MQERVARIVTGKDLKLPAEQNRLRHASVPSWISSSSASILASARSSHVVAVFRGGDAVAYEHDRTGGFPAEEKFRGRKSSGKCRIVGFADFGIVEAVGPPELGIGGDFEGLIEALAVGRLEAEALEFAGNEGARLFQFGAAGGPAFQRRRSQKLDIARYAFASTVAVAANASGRTSICLVTKKESHLPNRLLIKLLIRSLLKGEISRRRP